MGRIPTVETLPVPVNEDVQVMVFLPEESVRGKNGAAVLRVYSYARVAATWPGQYEGRDGTYAILNGKRHVIDSSVAHLASGLFFIHVVERLT